MKPLLAALLILAAHAYVVTDDLRHACVNGTSNPRECVQ